MHAGRRIVWGAVSRVALLGLMAVGCRAMADTSGAREIRNADIAFAKATAERGAEGWTSYFAEDGVMFQPGGVIAGRDSIRAVVTRWFADDHFGLTWEPTNAEVAESGDLGYTFGRYHTTGRDATGNAVQVTGSYVTVWRKQADGSWKVALDIGNPDGG